MDFQGTTSSRSSWPCTSAPLELEIMFLTGVLVWESGGEKGVFGVVAKKHMRVRFLMVFGVTALRYSRHLELIASV